MGKWSSESSLCDLLGGTPHMATWLRIARDAHNHPGMYLSFLSPSLSSGPSCILCLLAKRTGKKVSLLPSSLSDNRTLQGLTALMSTLHLLKHFIPWKVHTVCTSIVLVRKWGKWGEVSFERWHSQQKRRDSVLTTVPCYPSVQPTSVFLSLEKQSLSLR